MVGKLASHTDFHEKQLKEPAKSMETVVTTSFKERLGNRSIHLQNNNYNREESWHQIDH